MCGKAGKYRLARLNPNSEQALGAYLQARTQRLNNLQIETDALFFGLRNSDGGSISVRSVHRMLLDITKVRGLPPMHPHLLRHACATHLLNNGCSLDVIADLLGHDNLDITAHYAQVSTRLMMDTYIAPLIRTQSSKKSIPKKGEQVCASLHAFSWVSSLLGPA